MASSTIDRSTINFFNGIYKFYLIFFVKFTSQSKFFISGFFVNFDGMEYGIMISDIRQKNSWQGSHFNFDIICEYIIYQSGSRFCISGCSRGWDVIWRDLFVQIELGVNIASLGVK